MGNTPSTPPPLVSINAPGNDVLVPHGTSLYAFPPATPGYHAPCPHTEAPCEHCQTVPLGPVYSRIPTRPRTHRHGRAEPDVKIREYEGESESTKLGSVHLRHSEGKTQDVRRRGYKDQDVHRGNALGGYGGLRGGQAQPGMYPGVEETGMSGMMSHAGIYPQMHPQMHPQIYAQGLNASPRPPVPSRYASHESKHGYGHHEGNVYAPQPMRPPPPSATGSSSSFKSRSRSLPSAIQAAIDEAIQKSTGAGSGSRNPLGRSKSSPLFIRRDNSNDSWGGGIDTCICTTNCKCRRGERAVKWYEGTADIGGKEVPVRAKLNTRFVLKDDIGKDCGDHSGCKKKTASDANSTSSISDTEASKPKTSKKSKKKAKRPGKAEELNALQAELERIKHTAAMKQNWTYAPPPFPGYAPPAPTSHDPSMTPRTTQTRDPHRHGRTGGMESKTQGTHDPLTTRNPRMPRMPPRSGMRMRIQNHRVLGDYKGMGPRTAYARVSALCGKGKHADSGRRPRFGMRKEEDSVSELVTSDCSREGGLGTGRGKRGRAFELDDTDVSLEPRRQSAMRGLCSDGEGRPALYNLSKRGDGEKNGGTCSQGDWLLTSPSGRRGGVRKGRAAGKQARAETDDEEGY